LKKPGELQATALDDIRALLRELELLLNGGTELRGRPIPADWDSDLMPAMIAAGKAIHEERILDGLLDDLRTWLLSPEVLSR
jgi:hypothetical protein